jgi:hypothetical protein
MCSALIACHTQFFFVTIGKGKTDSFRMASHASGGSPENVHMDRVYFGKVDELRALHCRIRTEKTSGVRSFGIESRRVRMSCRRRRHWTNRSLAHGSGRQSLTVQCRSYEWPTHRLKRARTGGVWMPSALTGTTAELRQFSQSSGIGRVAMLYVNDVAYYS